MKIANSILHKHGSHKVSTFLPLLVVGGENAVAQEGPPHSVEFFSFAIIGEFSGQDGLDMLRLASEKVAASTRNINLNQIRACRCRVIGENRIEKRKHPILGLCGRAMRMLFITGISVFLYVF